MPAREALCRRYGQGLVTEAIDDVLQEPIGKSMKTRRHKALSLSKSYVRVGYR